MIPLELVIPFVAFAIILVWQWREYVKEQT